MSKYIIARSIPEYFTGKHWTRDRSNAKRYQSATSAVERIEQIQKPDRPEPYIEYADRTD